MEFDQIKAALHETLNERDGIDRATHRAHHDYLRRRLTSEERRDQNRQALHDKIKATVIGGLLLALLTVTGTMLYNVGKFVLDLYESSQSQRPPRH